MDNNEFLIKDYTNAKDVRNPDMTIVDFAGLIKTLDKARYQKEQKICVYTIGKCIIDWS